jgi:hypothetical protein
MRSVKSTTLEKNNAWTLKRPVFVLSFFLFSIFSFAQDNSPYSRFGLGDQSPRTNISTRGMGGIVAGVRDPLSINFTNPASYSSFLYSLEPKSRKMTSGRVVLDVGVNFQNHTLREPNNPQKFTSGDALFSYLQVGMPIRPNWGVALGLRQLSRIGYKVSRNERIFDPVTGNIDSALTEFNGDGGSYLASAGTGFAIKGFSFGFNFGYIFGKKDFSTSRFFINDTVEYISSNQSTNTSFGNIFLNAGIQYRMKLKEDPSTHALYDLTFGAYGNMKQTMHASQDLLRETIVRTADNGDLQLDSVFQQSDVKGKVVYPSTFGAGVVLKKLDKSGWSIGVDYVRSNWDQYRFYGLKDSVRSSSEIHVGGELYPQPKEKKYFSNVTYRGGFFFGKDNIHVGKDLAVYGISVGGRFPIGGQRNLNQATVINASLEYSKRGNSSAALRDDYFRISIGISFSDLWFIKKKYE